VLPAEARLRATRDFRITYRHGVRVVRPTLVLHAFADSPYADSPNQNVSRETIKAACFAPVTPKVGFVVSKAVGNAVTRNRVKRKLRHLVRGKLVADRADGCCGGVEGQQLKLVVRALPAAASKTSAELGQELSGAWDQAKRKLIERNEKRNELRAEQA
jgi:ribonuclease P protein component